MKTLLNKTKKVLGASLLAAFAVSFAGAQSAAPDTAPSPDTTRNTSAGDTVGTANGNTSPDNTSMQATRPTGRSVIHDRGTSSIGQYDPSGNSLPPERSPYEYIGAPAYNVKRTPKQQPAQPQYRDYGGTVFRQPDPMGNGTPATPMIKEDPYASNQPAAPNTPVDSTNTQSSWGNTGEAGPTNGNTNPNGTKRGPANPAPKSTAPADTTKPQRIKGWDY